MKLEQAHIDQIRDAFAKMQTREDLLHLLNEVKPLIYGEKTVPFSLKQLSWHANSKLGGKRYIDFTVKKKSGADRTIHAPVPGLKSIQKVLSYILQCVFEPHKAAMGFVREKSIVDNARLHVGNKYVFNIDLKDFFPSVDQARVWKCLQLRPFNLTKESSMQPQFMRWEDFKKEYLKTDEAVSFFQFKGRLFAKKENGNITEYDNIIVASNFDKEKEKYVLFGRRSLKSKAGKSLEGKFWLVNNVPNSNRLEIANIIAALCCTEMEVERKNGAGEWQQVKRNVLPQGAPTSPVLTNVVCQRLDHLLSGVAKRFGLTYSRYADDITFSSKHDVYQEDGDFRKELNRIISEQGFHVNNKKTRLQKEGYRMEVTGLLVNEKVNVQKRYIKQIRMWLYYWENYGYDRAYGFFKKQYFADKGDIAKGEPSMENVIAGKLEYLRMVKGTENALYSKLKARLEQLAVERTSNAAPSVVLSLDTTGYQLTSNQQSAPFEVLAKGNGSRLRININSIDAIKGRLNRDIIYRKGASLPLEELLDNAEKEEAVIDLSKHRPKDVNKFLLNFRSSEGIKFLTHEYDRPNVMFDREEILSLAKAELAELLKLYTIPKALIARIYWFAFEEIAKEWRFFGKIHSLNWQAPELTEWLMSNPGKHPAAEDSPFRDVMIIPFRKSYEIKAPELEELIIHKLSEKGLYSRFDFGLNNSNIINLEKANFYTDVDALSRGLGYIFNSIAQRINNSNKLKIEFSRLSDSEGRKRIITITHVSSHCDKPLDKTELLKGDLLEAEKAFFGICDWSIISRSPDETFNKINILFDIESGTKPKDKIDVESIEGFTHVLTFYS